MKLKKLLVILVCAITLSIVGCTNSELPEESNITSASETKESESIEIQSESMTAELESETKEETEESTIRESELETEIQSELETDQINSEESDMSVEDHDSLKTYRSGTYLVGTDIPAGEYLIEVSEKTLAYVEVASDSSGKLESVITNDNFQNRIYISVNVGEYLNFTSGKAVLASEADPYECDGTYPSGMYLVGKDIPAGEYTISAVKGTFSGTGYLEVTSTPRGNAESVIEKDNFESEKDQVLEEGQYLFLSGAHIGDSDEEVEK